MAIAPPLTLSFSCGIPELAHARQHLRGERLVDLDQVDVVDRQPGALERLPAGGDRAHAHVGRVDAGGRRSPRSRASGALPRRSAARSEPTTRQAAPSLICDALPAVTEPPSRKAGLQRASFSSVVSRRTPSSASTSTVSPRRPFDGRGLDRHDLAGERARVLRRGGAPVRLDRERVLVGARDLVALGHVLGRLAHALGRVALRHARVDEAPADRRVGDLRRAAREAALGLELDHGRAGHRLDAAGEQQVGVAGADRRGTPG